MVYSSAGYRGARVAGWLSRAGYTNVRNLAGRHYSSGSTRDGRSSGRTGPRALVHPYDRRWGLLLEGRYRAEAPDVEKQSAGP